ncbi:MAG: uroporphyrinogen-III synthase [Bacteroidales bacterium]|jgi:uroporphyrinogen-III synthase|nr:uroporphyrinogen-III synthase [Bacteroidales bacterium]
MEIFDIIMLALPAVFAAYSYMEYRFFSRWVVLHKAEIAEKHPRIWQYMEGIGHRTSFVYKVSAIEQWGLVCLCVICTFYFKYNLIWLPAFMASFFFVGVHLTLWSIVSRYVPIIVAGIATFGYCLWAFRLSLKHFSPVHIALCFVGGVMLTLLNLRLIHRLARFVEKRYTPQRGAVIHTATDADRELQTSVNHTGFNYIHFPLVCIAPLPYVLPDSEWYVFTSRHGAEQALLHGAALHGHRIAVIGPSSAAPLRQAGIEPDFVGSGQPAAVFAEELRQRIPRDTSVALLLGDLAPDTLERGLIGHAAVERTNVYQSRPPANPDAATLAAIADNRCAVILLYSPSAVANLEKLTPLTPSMRLFGVGTSTAEAIRQRGIEPVATAPCVDKAAINAELLSVLESLTTS